MKKPAVIIVHAIIDLINTHLVDKATYLSGKFVDETEGEGEVVGASGVSSGLLLRTSGTASNRKPFSDTESHSQSHSQSESESIHRDNGGDISAVIEGDFKTKLLCHILGKPEDIRAALSYSDFSSLIQTEDSASPKNLTDWKDACIDPAVPVPLDWAMEGLKGLEGRDFEQWLNVLSVIQTQCCPTSRKKNSHSSSSNSSSSSSSSNSSSCSSSSSSSSSDSVCGSDRGRGRGSKEAVSLFMPSHADNIYGLLRLVFPDQTHRWRTLTPDPQSALLSSEEEECMVVNDFTAASSAAYCSLLASISQHMASEHYQQHSYDTDTGDIGGERRKGHKRGGESISYCERFVRVASAEVASTSIFSSKGSTAPPASRKTGSGTAAIAAAGGGAGGAGGGAGGAAGGGGVSRPSFGLGVKAEAGVMDLCGKVLEALTSQTICGGR
jgi:hypothetical protein